MVRYNIISTGSDGNATILEDFVLIDCGVPYKALEPYVSKLKLVLLTHIHSDHFKKQTIKRLAAERPTLRFGCCRWLVPPLLAAGVPERQIDVLEPRTMYGYGLCNVIPFMLIQDCTKDVDAEDLLIQELQLLTAREAFLLQRISAVQEKKQHIQSVHTSKSGRLFTRLDEDKEKEARDKEAYIERIDAKVDREERLPGTTVETSTTVESSYLIVERLERLLTDVQRQKSKVIQQLADLRRMSNSGKNELVDDWVAAVEAADTEVEDADDGTETT